jgi:hypothetical protein
MTVEHDARGSVLTVMCSRKVAVMRSVHSVRRRRRSGNPESICVLLIAVLAAACGSPTKPTTTTTTTTPPTTFSLSGKVTDSTTSTAISSAIVFIADGPNAGKSATSDASGNYTFAGLQQSGFTVTASACTYLSQSKSVTLTANQTLDFALQSPPPPPSQFVSTPPPPTSSTDPIIGQYALTIRVGSECAALPDTARNPNYTATIDSGSTGSDVVTLSDAVFLMGSICGPPGVCNQFFASREGEEVRFQLFSNIPPILTQDRSGS